MLCLSRKSGEKVVIGDGPEMGTVTVISINGDRVRLGFEFPKAVPVHRQEVYNSIQNDKSRATVVEVTVPSQG